MAAVRSLFVVIAAGLLGGGASAQQKGEAEYLAQIKEASTQMVTEVTMLWELIYREYTGPNQKELADIVNPLIAEARFFHSMASGGKAPREQLYREFQPLDEKLHALLEGIRALGDQAPTLQRPAYRLEYADQQLHFALSSGDTA